VERIRKCKYRKIKYDCARVENCKYGKMK